MRILVAFVLGSLACLAADTGRLRTEVDPGRAGVFIDGKYVGPAANFKIARTYEVTPGEHEVRLVDPRYQWLPVLRFRAHRLLSGGLQALDELPG